ncbi:hypothetical protein GCM10010530_20700 [Kribbella aluminosa]
MREATTLDRLSHGRLTLGVGLGSDRFAQEFSKTGEELDDSVRAEWLDETLDILTAGWTGEPVNHHGKHYTVDGARFLPRPVAGRVCGRSGEVRVRAAPGRGGVAVVPIGV